jgi:hypothetical protein
MSMSGCVKEDEQRARFDTEWMFGVDGMYITGPSRAGNSGNKEMQEKGWRMGGFGRRR